VAATPACAHRETSHPRPLARTKKKGTPDLATALLTARGTDGYQTVWFYQRLSAACAKHER